MRHLMTPQVESHGEQSWCSVPWRMVIAGSQYCDLLPRSFIEETAFPVLPFSHEGPKYQTPVLRLQGEGFPHRLTFSSDPNVVFSP